MPTPNRTGMSDFAMLAVPDVAADYDAFMTLAELC
jgi:hypothetical protein